MTEYPADYVESPQLASGGEWAAEPFKVLDVSERHTPEFSSCMTWPIPLVGVGQPVQILQRQPQRFKAKLVIINVGTLSSSFSAFGSATSVVAGTPIVTTGTLPAGVYTVTGMFNLIGTATFSDATNIQLLVGSTVIVRYANGSISETPQPLMPVTITIPPGGATVSIQAVGTGTAAISYNASLSITPVSSGGSIVFNSKLDPLQGASPQGFTVTNLGPLPDWESQQPLYAVSVGAAGVVTVYDETFSRR